MKTLLMISLLAIGCGDDNTHETVETVQQSPINSQCRWIVEQRHYAFYLNRTYCYMRNNCNGERITFNYFGNVNCVR